MKKQYNSISLLSFQSRFPTEQACRRYLLKRRWPNGVRCRRCSSEKLDYLRTKKVYQCRRCNKQTSLTAGTIFHQSHIPLRKWFWAIFLMSSSKKGVSSLFLQRELGLKTYRSAWRMTQKIRRAMQTRNSWYELDGVVQSDEINIGGKQDLKNPKYPGKTPFLMMVQENASGTGPAFVHFEELEAIDTDEIAGKLRSNVKAQSTLKTDGARHYLSYRNYRHSRKIYETDPIGTQRHLHWLNVITANLKRFLLSTFHGVHPAYRGGYLAEFEYRFNRRYNPAELFDRLLSACLEVNLAWAK